MESEMNSSSQATMAPASLSPATPFSTSPSCGLEVSTAQSLPHDKRQYTASEWQSKKEVIEELYLDRGMSLKEVMGVLAKEPHHFHATLRMYKQRLERWGYFKNCTERRVKTILHDKTERGAVKKVVTFGRNGEDRNIQKITKYLSRKKMTLSELTATENEGPSRADIISTTSSEAGPSNGSDIELSSINPHFTENEYEENCPYRPWARTFRLIEKFPSGATYQGDSFGYHSYIDIDEDRDCSPQCLCRHHDISKTFTFVVHKSLERLDVSVLSDSLYSELVTLLEPLDTVGFQVRIPSEQKSVNGLVLLKHHSTLRNRLDFLRSVSPPTQLSLSPALDMGILVEGLLSDGEVLKSMGYEDLYERGFLDYELWKKFQQQKIKRDIAALDNAFCAIDDLENTTPSRNLNCLNNKSSFSQLPLNAVENIVDAGIGLEELSQVLPFDDALELDNTKTFPIFGEVNHCTQSVPDIPANPVLEDFNDRLSCFEINDPQTPILQPPSQLQTGSNTSNPTVEYTLWEMTEEGDEEHMHQLLVRGANVNGDYLFHIPLVAAVTKGHEQVVQLLLDYGANVNISTIDGNTPLSAAVRNRHESIVRMLLDQGADVNRFPGGGETTPLITAAKTGHESIVRMLLDQGANVNRFPGRGETTPLITAVENRHELIVRMLLDQGADVNRFPGRGETTPLIAAVENGHESIVRMLLDQGADVNRFPGRGETTPLTVAVRNRHESIVRMLLDQGADVNRFSGWGETTPLTAAVENGHKSIVRMLLDQGADVNRFSGWGKTTPLIAAVRNRHESIVRMLLDQGADVNRFSGRRETTPLIAAVRNRHKSIVRMLLDQGAHVNRSAGWVETTPLIAAVRNGHESIMRMLLDQGADVNRFSGWGETTPLIAAVENGHKSIVRMLLDQGADVNRSARWGETTPLTAAVENGHESIVRMLLDQGADVNRFSGWGETTPLITAVENGHESIVRMLLDQGADVNRFSRLRETTPLIVAVENGHESIVRMLLYQGADVDHLERFLNDTPLTTAAKNGYDYIVLLLLNHGANEDLALVFAARKGQEAVMRQLLLDGADANVITPFGTALSAAAATGCNVDIVNFLLQQGADVGTAVCILQERGDVYSAKRLLKAVSHSRSNAATARKLRDLRLQFVRQYILMINAGKGTSAKCRNLARQFRNYRDAWMASIRAMRRLCNGGCPETFYDTMSFLCLARAIVANLGDNDHGEYLEDFLLDLNRWQELFKSNTDDLTAYQEAVYSMWGVVLDQTEVAYDDALISFQQLASTLIGHTQEPFGLNDFECEGFERSQRRWLDRTSQAHSTTDQPMDADDGLFYEDNIQTPEPGAVWGPDPPVSSTILPLKKRIEDDISTPVVEPMVILLMAGAVFAIVIVFLQG